MGCSWGDPRKVLLKLFWAVLGLSWGSPGLSDGQVHLLRLSNFFSLLFSSCWVGSLKEGEVASSKVLLGLSWGFPGLSWGLPGSWSPPGLPADSPGTFPGFPGVVSGGLYLQILGIPKNSKISEAEGAKTMHMPKNSKNSKVFQTIGLRAGIRPGVDAGE